MATTITIEGKNADELVIVETDANGGQTTRRICGALHVARHMADAETAALVARATRARRDAVAEMVAVIEAAEADQPIE